MKEVDNMALKRTSLEKILAGSPLLVLDGSMSTALENMGHIWQTVLNTGEIMVYRKRHVMNFISTEWNFSGKQEQTCFLWKHSRP